MLVAMLLCTTGQVCASDEPKRIALEPTVTQEEAKQIELASSLFEKNPRAAIEQLRKHVGPEASAALDFALAAMLAKRERYLEAEKALDAALGKFPAFRRARLLTARVRILQGKTDKAIAPLRQALKLGADDCEVFKLLAYCHTADGHAVAAESAYRRVLALVPEDKEATAGLAKALLMQERADDAAPLLRALCEKTPDKAEYWKLRANTEMARENRHHAIVLLECARRLCNIDQQSLLALGDLYFSKGLYDKATSCYSDATAKNTLSTDKFIRYAEALLAVEQPALAAKLLDRELPEDKEHPERLHLVRAKIALAKRDRKSARIHLDAAVSARPMSGDALLMLARLQKDDGKYERALLTLQRASRLKSHQRRSLLEIAQIHVDRLQYREALEALEEAQALEFDPRVARYAEQIRKAQSMQE